VFSYKCSFNVVNIYFYFKFFSKYLPFYITTGLLWVQYGKLTEDVNNELALT